MQKKQGQRERVKGSLAYSDLKDFLMYGTSGKKPTGGAGEHRLDTTGNRVFWNIS